MFNHFLMAEFVRLSRMFPYIMVLLLLLTPACLYGRKGQITSLYLTTILYWPSSMLDVTL